MSSWREFYENKNILITGASSGIGREMVEKLASVEGTGLVLLGRDKKALAEGENTILKGHDKYQIFIRDLSNLESLFNIKENLKSDLVPDVLVNNAGVGLYGRFWKQDMAEIDGMMKVNINSLVYLTHTFLPAMIKKRSGGILNIASISSFVPCPGLNVYGATKTFVKAFTEGLRVETESKGIHVVCYHPAGTDTKWHKRAL